MLEQAGKSARAALKLPQLLSEFFVTTGRGETRIEITSRQVVDELKNIARIGKGFIFAILTAALGLISVFLHINHFDTESYWTAAGTVLLFLWVLHVIKDFPDHRS
jgi:hypothetical protein